MGVGVAKGENRIVEAVRLAVNSPLLDTTIEGATGVILNVVGGNDLTFDEVKMAATLIRSVVDYSANIIFGACIDPNISDEVEVTVIATGFPSADRVGRIEEARPMEQPIVRPMGNPYATYAQPVQQPAVTPTPIVTPDPAPIVEATPVVEEVPTYEAEPDDVPAVEEKPDRLPAFVRRLLGKKK